MLVLGRKPGETILIGDIRIMLVACNGGGARIGIEAPPSVNIVREELIQKRDASQPVAQDGTPAESLTRH